MAHGLRLVGLTKQYKRHRAVDNLDLDIVAGQFYTLLGPSGCGKTTTLRMIAGLERGDAGSIYLDDRLISSVEKGIFVEPEGRGMGMVFQSYAVWPHMTVGGNVEFPLKLRGVPAAERRERVRDVLHLVGLDGYEDRGATQLSGGQQQRVALARALVYNPDVLLLDEPLSNLDAKLREQMRVDLRILQRKLKMTTIFVTHDQIEAMVVSDQVVVMNAGKIEQIGTPEEVYQAPSTRFVMDFLGRVNYIPSRVGERRGDMTVLRSDGTSMQVPSYLVDAFEPDQRVMLCLRPEDISLAPEGQQRPEDLRGVVEVATFLGHTVEYLVRVGEITLRVEGPATRRRAEGDTVYLRIDPNQTHIWSLDSADPVAESTPPAVTATI
jgi:ABC-type Fe3+/spermidine/putrescine transport system ATPase subunit